MSNVSVVVVYHSGFGHTEVIAQKIAEGVTSTGASVTLQKVTDEINWDALNAADAIVFGSPTYMGGPAWEFKKFADASGQVWFGQGWKDKIAAGFTNSLSNSGDKNETLHYFFTLASQHSMIWVPQGIMRAGAGPDDLNRNGFWSGLGAQSDNESPEVTPPAGDRQTAFLFGERIAQAAARWKN